MEEESKRNQPDFNDIEALKAAVEKRNEEIAENYDHDAPIYDPEHAIAQARAYFGRSHFTVCKALLEEILHANVLDKDSANAFKEIDEEKGFSYKQLEILEHVILNSRRIWMIQGLVEQVKRGEIAKKIIKQELGL